MLYSLKIELNKVLIFIILYAQFFFNIEIFPLTKYFLFHKYKEIENYLKICSDYKYFNPKKINISNEPKISIISPVYNTGIFVIRLLRSIQYQHFNDIEIILINDCSEDNSFELMKKFMNEDKRIKLIKNKKNKGTFSSRNIGILKSKGKYIILPDPDDILLINSLKIFYNFSIKYNYEFLRFNVYLNFGKTFFGEMTKKLESRPIYQPELSTYLFYGLGFLKQIDYNVCNKFIKRESLIRGLNIIKPDLNIYMTNHEDGILNYILYRSAKSSYFLKKFGYYYIKNNKKIKKNYSNFNYIKFRFIHLIYVFNYSRNTKYEKDMTNEIFNRLFYNPEAKRGILLLKKEFIYFINMINKLNKNDFFLDIIIRKL